MHGIVPDPLPTLHILSCSSQLSCGQSSQTEWRCKCALPRRRSDAALQEVEQHTNTPVAVILDSIGPEVRVLPIPGAVSCPSRLLVKV